MERAHLANSATPEKTMSTSSTPGTEPEPKGGAGPMRPEQFLREESERITALLQMRRRATTVIAAIFALATVCAVFVLARYVQGEQRRINDLGARLTSADDRMMKQEEWLNRLRKNSDLVDSILTQYRTLIAGVQDSTKHYSDSLAAKLDVMLQSRIQSTERNAALWDTAWSKSGRSISDSLGDRLTREETRVMTFMNRLDTIPPRVAQHERQLSDVKA